MKATAGILVSPGGIVRESLKCARCGEEAKYRFSPDLDIKGIGSCEIDLSSVRDAYFMLLLDGERTWKSMTKGWWIWGKRKK